MINIFRGIQENLRLKKVIKKLKVENKHLKDFCKTTVLNSDEVLYIRHLIMQDEIINGSEYEWGRLCSETNSDYLDFITDIRFKIRIMEKFKEVK